MSSKTCEVLLVNDVFMFDVEAFSSTNCMTKIFSKKSLCFEIKVSFFRETFCHFCLYYEKNDLVNCFLTCFSFLSESAYFIFRSFTIMSRIELCLLGCFHINLHKYECCTLSDIVLFFK